jgi:hypothetical protein
MTVKIPLFDPSTLYRPFPILAPEDVGRMMVGSARMFRASLVSPEFARTMYEPPSLLRSEIWRFARGRCGWEGIRLATVDDLGLIRSP